MPMSLKIIFIFKLTFLGSVNSFLGSFSSFPFFFGLQREQIVYYFKFVSISTLFVSSKAFWITRFMFEVLFPLLLTF